MQELCTKIFKHNLGNFFILTVISLFNYPDSISLNKGLKLVENIFPILDIKNESQTKMISNNLLEKSLFALMIYDKSMEQTLIKFITEILVSYFKRSPFPENLLSKVPNANNKLKNLVKQVTMPKKMSLKKKAVRSFLKPIIGSKNINHIWEAPKIESLPGGKKKKKNSYDFEESDASVLFK